jgi:cytoskeletal protein CcmA (bactofilin family)
MAGGKSLFNIGGAKTAAGHEEISAFLGKDTVFEGKMTFEGVFRLEGRFQGEIFESGTLIIGETAVVRGKIEVNTIIINGFLEGEVSAKTRVEIHSTGKLYGTLMTPSLTIHEGGVLEGQCKMGGERDKESGHERPSRTVNHFSSA